MAPELEDLWPCACSGVSCQWFLAELWLPPGCWQSLGERFSAFGSGGEFPARCCSVCREPWWEPSFSSLPVCLLSVPGSDAPWLSRFQRPLRASPRQGQDQTCPHAGAGAVTGAPGLPAPTAPSAPRAWENSLGSLTEGVTAAVSPAGPAVAGCDPCPVSCRCLPGSNIKASKGSPRGSAPQSGAESRRGGLPVPCAWLLPGPGQRGGPRPVRHSPGTQSTL